MLLTIGFIERGISCDSMRKFFRRPIALSTWILRLAMLLVFFISATVSAFLFPQLHFLVKGGMFRLAPRLRRRSRIVKPRSAMMSSPFSQRSVKPQSSVRRRSDMFPPYRGDTNVNAPAGETATRHLKVLCDLYMEYVVACAFEFFFGLCTKNSVQSIMARVRGYFSLNCAGMCLCTLDLDGHFLRGCRALLM